MKNRSRLAVRARLGSHSLLVLQRWSTAESTFFGCTTVRHEQSPVRRIHACHSLDVGVEKILNSTLEKVCQCERQLQARIVPISFDSIDRLATHSDGVSEFLLGHVRFSPPNVQRVVHRFTPIVRRTSRTVRSEQRPSPKSEQRTLPRPLLGCDPSQERQKGPSREREKP